MFIRHTNIIWMLFITCTGAIDFATIIAKKDQKRPDEALIASAQKEAPVNYNNRVANLVLKERKLHTSFHREDMSFPRSASSVGSTPGLKTLFILECSHLKIF